MGRFLVLAILVVVAFWLIRRAIARTRGRGAADPAPRTGELVRCARCGVHLPKAEARSVEGLEYCSEEHARLGPGEGA